MKYLSISFEKITLKLIIIILTKILLCQILMVCLFVSCKNNTANSEGNASIKDTVLAIRTLSELEMEISKDPDNYKLLIDKLAMQNNDILPHDYQIQLIPIMSIALSNNEEQNFINYISTKFKLKPDEIDWLYLQYDIGFAAAIDTSPNDTVTSILKSEINVKPDKKTEKLVLETSSKIKISNPSSNQIKNDLIGKRLNTSFTFSQLSDIKSLKIVQSTESNSTQITLRIDMVLKDDKYQAQVDLDYRLVDNKWVLTKVTQHSFDEFVKSK